MRQATIGTLSILAALILAAWMAPTARAADPTTKPAADPAPPPKTITGEFVKWQDQDLIVLVDTHGVKKEVTLKVSAQLAITLNGKAAKREELKEQMGVVVTPAEGAATRIEAKAAPAAPKSGRGDDDDDDEDHHEGGHKRGGRERHDD